MPTDLSKLSPADLNRLAAELQGWWWEDSYEPTDGSLGSRGGWFTADNRRVSGGTQRDGCRAYTPESDVPQSLALLEWQSGNIVLTRIGGQWSAAITGGSAISDRLARAITEAWCVAKQAEKARA